MLVAVTGSPFCEHKKLKTACLLCKAASMADATAPPSPVDLRASPYTARHERDEKKEKRAAKADKREPVESSAAKIGGPGKPLMPKKARKQRVTAEDEAQAQAWWVKK
jgi:hypothetical protein